MSRELVCKYIISAERLEVRSAEGALGVWDLYAVVLSSESPSAEVRENVLQRVLAQFEGQVLRPDRIEIELSGVVRADLCDFRESFSLTKPLPIARAKVVIQFPFMNGDEKAFERLITLEEDLDRLLQRKDIGFVDGHDHGQGEFCMYCHGPKKEPLKEAVDGWLKKHPEGRWVGKGKPGA